MSTSPPGGKAIWILPIVIAICAVMVLPGGTFVQSSAHAGNPMASAAGVTSSGPVSAPRNAPSLSRGLTGTPSSSSGLGPSALSTPAPASADSQFSPSSYAPTSSLASEIPADLQNVPWVQDLLHPHSGVAPLASVPNLEILKDPEHVSSDGLVYPSYEAAPAPLGVTDYGLGATPYSYNASFVNGQVTFTAAPNVTQPASTDVIQPTAAAERLGYVGSEYEFGIQLNTIGVNLTIPGTYDATTNDWSGYVWAQNVVNWNSSGLHFIQDTWNFSLDSDAGWQYNSIYSGCGGNTAHANYILYIYGVFQCSEGNVPLTADDYPVTLSLYNNFTTNAQDRSQLVYGYSIYEAGTGTTISGIADTVVFNNTVPSWQSPMAPSNPPANTVNPFAPTPTYGLGEGFQQDAEIDIVGGIEGDNGVFTSINGSAQLMYANVTHDVFQNVPSAYNFGADTGETSTGIADYWTPSHVLEINQGPSMLYGLWNAQPQAAVPSGDVHIGGTISPSYGFVFVSNTPGVLYPWAETETDNMSWLPTSSTGAFSTYLPPLKAPWTTTYYVQAFADGYAEYNTTVTASTATLAITMTASAGVVDAPIYISSAAQASALAKVFGGSGTAPYVFEYITVNSNMSFDRLNDWSFPTFLVFQSEGVNSVVVNEVYLGTDSNGPNGNSYIWDYELVAFFESSPLVFLDAPYLTSGINVFYGAGDHVLNQDLEELCEYECLGDNGLQLTLWGDTDAWVNDTFSLFDYPGVWVGDSTDVLVTNTTAAYGYGVADVGNHGLTVSHLWDTDALGISATGSFDSLYEWINVTDGEGIDAGSDYGPTVSSIYDIPGTIDLTVTGENVTEDSLGANLTFSSGTTFNNIVVNDPEDLGSQGIDLDGSPGTTVNYLDAIYASGFYAWNATDLTFNSLVLEYDSDYYYNSQVSGSTGVYFNTPLIDDVYDAEDSPYGIGVIGGYDSGIIITDGFVLDTFGGMVFEYSYDFTGTNLNSTGSEFSYELDYNTAMIAVNGVNGYDEYIGFNLFESYPATVTNVVANDVGADTEYGAGVAEFDDSGNSVSVVTANNGSVGVRIDGGSTGNSVTSVDATSIDSEIATEGVEVDDSSSNSVTTVVAVDGAIGVLIEDSSGTTVTGVTVSSGSEGVIVDPSSTTTISDVTATDDSIGAIVDDSTTASVSTVAASNDSLGVGVEDSNVIQISGVTVTGISIGTAVFDSEFVTISSVTATGTIVQSPWIDSDIFGLPIAAIVTVEDTGVTISGVTATTFPAALYDDDSDGLIVSSLNATGGYYAVVLNDTYDSLFTGIGGYQDYQGMLLEDDAYENTITLSSFVDDTSYGVAIVYGSDNTVWNNNFIGDNGATSTYNPMNIQAFSSEYNQFYICTNDYCTTGVGNYWADWHTYGSNGYLAPYLISGATYDYFPIGPQETFTVTFTETGLGVGASWSVTLAGMTQSSTSPTISFSVPMGTYLYQVNSVDGYTASPTGGSITEAGATYNVSVAFTEQMYAVTVTEGGLAAGTAWSVTVNDQTQSTTGTTVTFYEPSGTGYSYSFGAVSGYNLPTVGASGTFNVTSAPTSLGVTYTPSSTPSYVQTSNFNNWLAVAIAVAVIALVIGLLAIFLRGRKEEPPAQGAQPWTPPPAAPAGGAPPASGSTGNWSEGPPSGGSPPS